jgi:hypothetical protein
MKKKDLHLKKASTALFVQGDRVRHVKSGGVYLILQIPDKLRIESTGEPAYLYAAQDLQWVRSQREMEDGRFVLCDP